MLFCHIHSTVKGRPNATLRRDKGLLGLPSIAFLDAKGRVLIHVPGDARSVLGFERTAQRARRYVSLREEAAAGDKLAQAEFLILQLEERQVPLAEARQRRAALQKAQEVPREKQRRLDELLFLLEISAEARTAGQDREKRRALGKKFLAMLKDGPRPTNHVSRGFWFCILEHTEAAKDVTGFELGLEGMRKALAETDPGKPWVAGLLRRYEEKLAHLKKDQERRERKT